MKLDEAFPSKYLSATDLQKREHDVTIQTVVLELVDEQKGEYSPIAYFSGKKKGLRLNKTNWNTISGMYTDESNNWIGKTIRIHPCAVAAFHGAPFFKL